MMHISILTLFPDMISGVLETSIIKRAQQKKLVTIHTIQIRDFATDSYKTVDDHPYGGGTGMILRVDVVDRALSYAKSFSPTPSRSILMDPQGKPYTQKMAKQLSDYASLIIVCAHYEGVDERIRFLVDQEISIGDYVLTGGELPALVITDSVIRLIPRVLTKPDATVHESFTTNLLEYPQYTRPETYKGMSVPDVLLSGHHAHISTWRDKKAQQITSGKRPDLLTEKKD
jgi:tRNA (guanine37-N1)-methyltransferase